MLTLNPHRKKLLILITLYSSHRILKELCQPIELNPLVTHHAARRVVVTRCSDLFQQKRIQIADDLRTLREVYDLYIEKWPMTWHIVYFLAHRFVPAMGYQHRGASRTSGLSSLMTVYRGHYL